MRPCLEEKNVANVDVLHTITNPITNNNLGRLTCKTLNLFKGWRYNKKSYFMETSARGDIYVNIFEKR